MLSKISKGLVKSVKPNKVPILQPLNPLYSNQFMLPSEASPQWKMMHLEGQPLNKITGKLIFVIRLKFQNLASIFLRV